MERKSVVDDDTTLVTQRINGRRFLLQWGAVWGTKLEEERRRLLQFSLSLSLSLSLSGCRVTLFVQLSGSSITSSFLSFLLSFLPFPFFFFLFSRVASLTHQLHCHPEGPKSSSVGGGGSASS
jgi:hypothetical protein